MFGPKSCLTFLPHIIDVWHEPSAYVACEGLSDLGHGPNQPTATIIGWYSASYHHGTVILTLVVARIDHPSDTLLASLFPYTSLMSSMNPVHMLLVKGSQTLVMDPTSLLQQSL